MLRFGPHADLVLIVAPALFEEANRTRTLLVGVLRRLAGRGVSSLLPDLPGQGESLLSTDQATLAGWREALCAAAAGVARPLVLAIRGGALVGAGIDAPRYHLSPPSGADLVRDMVRARLAAVREGGAILDPGDLARPGPPIEFTGNRISRTLLAELDAAHPPAADRTVRFDSDPRPADGRVPGAPPWRRSDPGDDDALAALLASDIADWITRCVD